jgi:SAM-dependent methyltransferase
VEELGEFRVADFVIAVEGMAIARGLSRSPADVAARAAEVGMVVATAESDLLATRIPLTRYDVEAGYTRWAPRYDGPNPAIETEAPIMRRLVSPLPAGRALDAACGTGRHSQLLVELGWDVVGVDATAGMLDVAREKVPSADLRVGRMEALPLEDASVDLVVCALALTHVEDLGRVYAEFARVLRPGGRVITSDMHPIVCLTFGMAGFPVDDSGAGAIGNGIHFVPNLIHHPSEYVAALVGAGLEIAACHEPAMPEDALRGMPTYGALPDATRQAYGDLPFLLIWEAVKT